MTKTPLAALALPFALTLLAAAPARAFSPELHNEDSRSYDYDVVCGGSTRHTNISAHTTTSLGLSSESCTLAVKGAGSAKLAKDMKCTIKGGALSCR